MKKIAAIALLSLKAAVRSKLFAGSALTLFACMAALSFLVKGDGTAVGEARVLIYYNVGISSALIGMLALIQACGAVSQEIAEKQIQLVRSKPVSAMHIWLGKWLGILGMIAVLVLVAGVTTRIALAARKLGGDAVDSEVLTARRLMSPVVESVDQEVEHRYHIMKDRGVFAENADMDAVKEQLKLAVIASRMTVGAGESRRWEFSIPAGCVPDKSNDGGLVELRSKFNAAYRDEKPMSCSWEILAEDGSQLAAFPPELYYDGLNRIRIPVEIVRNHRSITVVFRNEETKEGRTVVFNQTRGIEILASEGGFGMNLVRGMIIVFIIAGLIAALGLTLGSVFSFPVAVFAAVSVVIGSLTAHFFTTSEIMPHSHGSCADCATDEEHGMIAGQIIATGVEVVVGSVLSQRPAELLSEGLLISWRDVGRASLIMILLYPVLLFIGGSLGLSRRQLALPDIV